MSTVLRNAFGEILIEMAGDRDDFVLCVADSGSGTGTKPFADRFPERTFNFGIAEANMVSAAAGIASFGIIPVVNTYGVFATSRVADQVRNSVCYPRFNVKIVASHVGLDAGADGASHMSVEDMAIMRAIPEIIVLVPADRRELASMVRFMLDYDGPVYMRTTRASVPDVHAESYQYSHPEHTLLREGDDVTLAACGVMVQQALAAAELLSQRGISAEVINASTIKPLNSEVLFRSARKTGRVVTLEDHNVIGGLYGAVCEAICRTAPVPVVPIGIPDRFGVVGTVDEIYAAMEMTPPHIEATVRNLVQGRT
jgi:transketolase